jgi:uncharacterized LabA/DUF88 family protein
VGKNVAVFVDVANIFYAAKAAGVDIDYVTLLKSASAGRDLVRAYAYTGLDPDNENQRNFHDFLRRSNYKVVSKDIRKYGDGKVKANLDIELVVDMMKTARNLDIAIVVSGDGDFAPAIRAVQEQGVRVEVISFRGNTSSDLIEVADQFTDIIQLAKVEKGSRSGRRVSDDDADLSMTEVPDKQTEGTGVGRGRGGRGRGRGRDAEPVAATAAPRGRGRGRPAAAAADGAPGVVALPGERLSRLPGSLTEADLARAEVFTLDSIDDEPNGAPEPLDGTPVGVDGEEGPRRRRRRGGRGRGRGRGREGGAEGDVDVDVDAAPESSEPAAAVETRETRAPRRSAPRDLDEDAVAASGPKGPRTTPFGSVWDSQIGTPSRAAESVAPVTDDEDFDEPEIPEYLIAEQRRSGGGGGGGGNRGARGGRSAYQAAMSRERYGRGGGGGGINRYPDVSARTAGPAQDRSYDRGDRGRAPEPRRSGGGEWSEVPPELEAQLRAQLTARPAAAAPVARIDADVTEAPAAKPRATRSRKPAATATDTATTSDDAVAAKPRATRAKKAVEAPAADATSSEATAPKASATRTRKTTTATKTTASKPRATRAKKVADTADEA